jgi:hypothetical protein
VRCSHDVRYERAAAARAARALAALVALLGIILCAVHAGAAPGARSCPVTIPTQAVPPDAGFSAAAFNYGNARLRAHLGWPHGILAAGTLPNGDSRAIVNADGSISTKVGWWRGAPGRLVIRGGRLDARAAPLRAHAGDGYGSRGFQPSRLTFPTVGCWRVVGAVGRARLTFVVKVTKLKS